MGTLVFLVVGLALVVITAFAFVAGMRRDARTRAADLTDQLNPESRSMANRIRRLVQELEEVASKPSLPTGLRGIANEAVSEAQRVLDQVQRNLIVRQELKRLSYGGETALREKTRLEESLSAAPTEIERASMQTAIEAKDREIAHYADITTALANIDAQVRLSESNLSETKARIAAALGQSTVDSESETSLRDSIGRMRALNLTIDEVKPWLTNQAD